MTIKFQLGTVACVAPHYVHCTFKNPIKVISGFWSGYWGTQWPLGTLGKRHSEAGALGRRALGRRALCRRGTRCRGTWMQHPLGICSWLPEMEDFFIKALLVEVVFFRAFTMFTCLSIDLKMSEYSMPSVFT